MKKDLSSRRRPKSHKYILNNLNKTENINIIDLYIFTLSIRVIRSMESKYI